MANTGHINFDNEDDYEDEMMDFLDEFEDND